MSKGSSKLEYAYAIQNKETLLWKQGYTSDFQRLRRRFPPEHHHYVIVDSLNSGIYKGVLSEFINTFSPLMQGVKCIDREYFSETEWFKPDPEQSKQLNTLKADRIRDTERAQIAYAQKLRKVEEAEESGYLEGGNTRFFVEHKNLLKGRTGCGCLLTLLLPGVMAFALIIGASQPLAILGYYLLFLLIGIREEIREDRLNVQKILRRLKEKNRL